MSALGESRDGVERILLHPKVFGARRFLSLRDIEQGKEYVEKMIKAVMEEAEAKLREANAVPVGPQDGPDLVIEFRTYAYPVPRFVREEDALRAEDLVRRGYDGGRLRSVEIEVHPGALSPEKPAGD